MNEIKGYITKEGYLLEVCTVAASVDYWSEHSNVWEPLDVSAEFLQGLINEVQLPLVVGERLGWREMGSQYSGLGYFRVEIK